MSVIDKEVRSESGLSLVSFSVIICGRFVSRCVRSTSSFVCIELMLQQNTRIALNRPRANRTSEKRNNFVNFDL